MKIFLKELPSPVGRGAGGEGREGKLCGKNEFSTLSALTLTLSQREKGPILLTATLAFLCLAASSAAMAQSTDPLSKPAPAWQPQKPEEIKAQAFAWLEEKKIDAEVQAKAKAIWADLAPTAPEDDLLVRLSRTFALIDPKAAKLVEMCSQSRSQLVVPSQSWLGQSGLPPLFSKNLRLLYAEWLVHESLFDEAQEQLSGLSPGDVAAPAALLFYKSVVCHALLNKESGLESIDELLQGAESSPRRYVALARLMQDDLQGLEEDTLDHIARRMEDIRRRLDLGRAGPKVRQQQDGVIRSLDKMIKKLEDEQKQSGGNPNGIQSTNPARQSTPAAGKGPGEVTKKNIGSESGWGDLPPKQREEAMQQIGRDFPSHYRDVIEQYFRRLASEESKPEEK